MASSELSIDNDFFSQSSFIKDIYEKKEDRTLDESIKCKTLMVYFESIYFYLLHIDCNKEDLSKKNIYELISSVKDAEGNPLDEDNHTYACNQLISEKLSLGEFFQILNNSWLQEDISAISNLNRQTLKRIIEKWHYQYKKLKKENPNAFLPIIQDISIEEKDDFEEKLIGLRNLSRAFSIKEIFLKAIYNGKRQCVIAVLIASIPAILVSLFVAETEIIILGFIFLSLLVLFFFRKKIEDFKNSLYVDVFVQTTQNISDVYGKIFESFILLDWYRLFKMAILEADNKSDDHFLKDSEFKKIFDDFEKKLLKIYHLNDLS